MALRNVVFGSEGDQWNTYSDSAIEPPPYPLGQRMELPDGRMFRFALMGAVVGVAGSVYQSEVPLANFDELVTAAAAVGSETINITTGATALTVNQLQGGFANIEDDAGEGRAYKIKSNPAIGTTTAGDITLEAPIQVALTAATTTGLTRSPYASVIIHPSPATAAIVGVAVSAIPAGEYGWLQTRGPASVLTEGTLVIANPVRASETTNGGVTVVDWDEAGVDEEQLGTCMEVAATGEHSLVNLKID